jgi:general secretion pathway protein D
MNGMVQRSLVGAALMTLVIALAARLVAQTNPASPVPGQPPVDPPRATLAAQTGGVSAVTAPGKPTLAAVTAAPAAAAASPAPTPPAATAPIPAPPVVATPSAAALPTAAPPPPAGRPEGAPVAGTGAAPPPPVRPAAPAPGATPAAAPEPAMTYPVQPAAAQPAATAAAAGQKMISLSFQDAPVDQVLAFYAELTGRTMIKAQGINAVITLRGQTKLSEDEVKQAIESVLALNNITLVPLDEKFFKVVQPPTARQEGLPIRFTPDGKLREGDGIVSQVIEINHIQITEAVPILQQLLHGYGKLQQLTASAILVTDTESNIRRVLELIEYIDRPAETKVDTRIYELHEAIAADVAQRLNELIADPNAQQRRPTVTIVQPTAPTPPGVVRAPTTGSASIRTDVSLADRGIISGQVKIVADDRTNILIIISDPANFPFFENMIKVLDRAVEPETLVKVYTLDYATADEVADLLSALIGGTSSARRSSARAGTSSTRSGTTSSRNTSSRTSSSRNTSSSANRGSSTTGDNRSQSIRDYIASQVSGGSPASTAGGGSVGEGIGELSDETRILPDLRSNSLLLLGRKTDLAVLEEIVKELDIMLAQVVIEAVIIEVTLSDEVSYGVDWLQRSMQAYSETTAGPGGGVAVRQPVMSWGGGFIGGASSAFRSGADVGRDVPLSAGGMTYYTTLESLNIDAVIRLAAQDSGARILSTPVILTTDNTEARIVAGEERPIVTATTVTTGGNQTSAYEYKNIGIELTVKPHINPQRVVVMDVSQKADNVGDIVTIDGNDVPVVTKRELEANIAVEDRSTIILGGLVSNADRNSRTKVPILGDIPILGRLFRSESKSTQRTELLVLITPYVLQTPQEARAETRRIHDSTGADSSRWFEKGFTDSDLARQKRIEVPQARKDAKLPPRIEEFLKGTATNQPTRSGARTIVVPQSPQSSRSTAPAPSGAAQPGSR